MTTNHTQIGTPDNALTSALPRLSSEAKADPYATPLHRYINVALLLGTIVILVILLLGSARAADQSWTGGSNATWSNTGNWSGGAIPGANDVARFDTSFPSNRQPNTGNDTVGAIWLKDGGTLDRSVLISIGSNNTFTLNANTTSAVIASDLGIRLDDTASHFTLTIAGGNAASKILLGANQRWLNNVSTSVTGLTVSSALDTNAKALTIDGTGNSSISGIISGSGSLTKSGSGTLTLSGANTFTGGVTINAGTVTAGSTTALGAAASATLTFGASSTGKFQLNGNNTTVIGLNTNATVGTPIIENGAAGAATLTDNTSGVDAYAGVLQNGGTGTLAFTKSGTGTLIFRGTNTYTGDTQINAGDLRFDAGGTANSSTIRLGATTGTSSATLSLGVGSGNNVGSALEARAGTTGLRVLRQLSTSGTNTYSGAITLNAALTLESSTGGTLLLQGSSVDVKTSALTVDTQVDGNGANSVNAQGAVTINEVLGSSLATGGSLIKDGGNTLILQSTSNNYTGTSASALNANGTRIAGGVLGIYGDGSLGLAPSSATNNVFFTASSLSSPPSTRTLQAVGGNIALASTRNINVASGVTGTFDSNGNTLTINGVINGTGGNIEKIGAGTLVLNGNNTYTGTTAVNAGTLLVNGNQSTATGAVTVNNSGTILGGSGTIGGSVTVNSGASLAPGASTAILRTGALTLNSSSNFVLELNGTTAGSGYDQVAVTGAVSLLDLSLTGLPNIAVTVGGSLSVNDKFFVVLNDGVDPVTGAFAQGATVTSAGYSFLINYADNGDGGALGNDISLMVTAIPEPTTWIAGALTLAAIGFAQRRRLARGLRRGNQFCMSGPTVMSAIANRLLTVLAFLSCLGAFEAKADIFTTCGIDLGAAGRTKAWAIFSLGGEVIANSQSSVVGDVGVAGSGNVVLTGTAVINGDLYYHTGGRLKRSGDSQVTGAIHHDAASDLLLEQGVTDAMNASDMAWAKPLSPQYANFSLNKTGNNNLTGAPGECVVLRLKNFVLTSGGTLTLQGSTSTAFIINVTGQFSLSSSAKILLSGGVTWDSVLFNIRGSEGAVTLEGQSVLSGFLMANNRTVNIAGSSTVNGEVIANKVSLNGRGRVILPPVASQ